jgi:RHH-type transcriptional regulator, rel operon repressor / antitoxin RelB
LRKIRFLRYNEYIEYRHSIARFMATSIRLPEEIEHRLDALAEKTGRTKAFYIREMILSHIDEMEDYYLAAEVVERLRKGQERTFSSQEVRQDLGLID